MLSESITFWKIEPVVYLILLGVSELVSKLWSPTGGSWLHVLLLVWIVYRGSTHSNRMVGKLLLTLSPCILVRIVSFAVSPKVFPGVWYYAVTEGIVVIGALSCFSVNEYKRADVGLRIGKHLWLNPLVLISGLGVGWAETHLVSPLSVTADLSWNHVWLSGLILMIFTGFAEEWLFRGIVQHAASLLYKPWLSVLYSASVFSMLHIGWDSLTEFLFAFSVGIWWGYIRRFTGSIFSISLSHGIANIVFFIILPNLNR